MCKKLNIFKQIFKNSIIFSDRFKPQLTLHLLQKINKEP